MKTSRVARICLGLLCWSLAAVLWEVSAHSPGALAEPIPVPAPIHNTVWGGFLMTGGSYRGVEATWVVPTVTCARSAAGISVAYSWIGEGGYVQGLSSRLIQAGIAAECAAGRTEYHAFYQWYPGIYATFFPVTVSPGDTVHVAVRETAADWWTLSVEDRTTGTRSATATVFRPDAGSLEFVVERPLVCGQQACDQVPLARSTPVTFGDIHVDTPAGDSGVRTQALVPVALVNRTTDHILATPARITGDSGLTVLWRRAE